MGPGLAYLRIRETLVIPEGNVQIYMGGGKREVRKQECSKACLVRFSMCRSDPSGLKSLMTVGRNGLLCCFLRQQD